MKKTNATIRAGKAALSVLVLSATLLFTNCNKQPGAEFETDKTEYTPGETVKLTNKSLDAKSYKWTFPDGQTSTASNVDYQLDNATAAGVYSVKLEAFSKKGNKTDEATKSFTVKDATGQVTVWTSNSTVSTITVKIDNVSMGSITVYYSSGSPSCGANGCVTATLKTGSHSISATDGNLTWSGTVNVTKNGCTTFELQ